VVFRRPTVPAITMRGITPLPLDALLCADAGIHRVFDLHHLETRSAIAISRARHRGP
jgi:hypothetical protein